MKKVLFVVSTTVRAGPTRQLLNLCRFLPDFGYTPHILTLSNDPQDNLAHEFRNAGIELHTLGLSRLSGLFLAKSRARKSIQKIAPHVLHSQGIRGDFICHGIAGTRPHVLTLRNYAWDDYPLKFGRIRGNVMAWQHIRLARRAQRPVACSESLARRLSTLRPDIQAVQNGVDTTEFRPADSDERRRLRHSLGLSNDRSLIISVGGLLQRKRPDILLEAFLQSNLPQSADLIFLGDGPLRSPLEHRAAGNPTVKLMGNVGNADEYLRCTDVFASTSRAEGLPNTVMEALASGLGVILSDIEPHKEFGVEAAGAGLIAKLDNPKDFAEKITEILTRDRTELSRSARALAENEFSAMNMASRYANIYNQLITK